MQDQNLKELFKLYPIHIFLYLGVFWIIWVPMATILLQDMVTLLDIAYLLLGPLSLGFYYYMKNKLSDNYSEYIIGEGIISDINMIIFLQGTRTIEFTYMHNGNEYQSKNIIADYFRETSRINLKKGDNLSLLISKKNPQDARIISYKQSI